MKNKILIVCILSILLQSCFMGKGIKGNGTITETKREVKSYQKIKVSEGIHVILIPSEENEVQVEVDENLQEALITEVSNGVLKIYFDASVYKFKKAEVTVHAKDINEIKVNSAASVKLMESLKVTYLYIDVSSAGSVNGMVDTNHLRIESSSASTVDLEGNTNHLEIDSSSSSSVKCKSLYAETASVEASSAATVSLNVNEKLEAKASSAGAISYRGNPEKVTKKTSSAGTVSTL